jgi:hypothetical protein
VNVAPPAQTSPPVGPATIPGAEQTAELPSDPPIVEPTQAPEPTATATPTEPEPPEPEDRPNLVILEFVVDEEPVLVGTPAAMTATVVNISSTDAGPFLAEIVLTAAGQADLVLESKVFEDGLAAGATTQLTTSVNPTEAAGLRLLARVDVTDQVDEEYESDNERVLEILVQSIGNITIPADGFTVTPNPDAPGVYLFYFTLVNTGPSTLVAPISVKFFAYTDAGDYVEWGSHNIDLDLDSNESQTLVVAYSVDPGTYRAYVLADPDNTLEETDEGDNEGYYDFVAP